MGSPASHSIIAPVQGLEVGAPGTLVDARSTPDCLNVEINRSLIRKRRGGSFLGTSLGERVLGFGSFQKDGVNYLVRVGPTKVEQFIASAWASISHAPLTGADDTLIDVAYPLIGGDKVMVFTNGIDPIRKWTGTGNDAVLGGSPPKANFLLNFFGYLLLANIDDGAPHRRRSRVQWSDTGDPEQWDESVVGSAAGSVDLLEDDFEITAMAYFGEFAAVHKQNSIWLGYLTGASDVMRFDRKETVAGAVAHKTIFNLPTGEQIFLSLQGFRLFNGITAPLVDSSINLDLIESLSPQYAYRSVGVIVKELNEVWFGVPLGSSTEPDTLFKYNYLTRQFYKDSFPSLTALGTFLKSTDDSWDSDPDSWDSDVTRWDTITALALNPRIILGYADGVTVERTDSADDPATPTNAPVNSHWSSKDFTALDLGLDEAEASFIEWQGVEVIARGTTILVSISTDEGVTFETIKTLTLGSSFPADTSPKMVYFRRTSTKLRVRFSNATLGGSFELKQFRLIGLPRERRRQ